MNDKDKHFIERYEELLNKGYCNCNEMNCIDNNSPRRILNIVKQLQSNWNNLGEWLEEQHQFIIEIPAYTKEISIEHKTMEICYENVLDKMNELERKDKE